MSTLNTRRPVPRPRPQLPIVAMQQFIGIIAPLAQNGRQRGEGLACFDTPSRSMRRHPERSAEGAESKDPAQRQLEVSRLSPHGILRLASLAQDDKGAAPLGMTDHSRGDAGGKSRFPDGARAKKKRADDSPGLRGSLCGRALQPQRLLQSGNSATGHGNFLVHAFSVSSSVPPDTDSISSTIERFTR